MILVILKVFRKFGDRNIVYLIPFLFPIELAIYYACLAESVVFFPSIISLRTGLLI